ncbi:Furry,-like protein [Daphnia magna]|uniref:Furry,-like protein n=1 Tax=Daphnia magna TaxID=35525 RepID=A0A164KAW3_9CRUS|nr:Furry,-like protein [Daphnia magna]
MLLPATPLTVVHYTATEANKYYVAPSYYTTAAPSYYTTAAPSYYTEPNYYTTTSSPLHSTLRPQNTTRLQVTTLKPTPHTPSQTTRRMLHKTMLLPLIILLRPGVLRYGEVRVLHHYLCCSSALH